ncbi:hypothetical protein DL767_004649 [Monosporascus sp. MG133]|nr:hypothetical protein DL767_004649 [Monosporascus sp. MG133]
MAFMSHFREFWPRRLEVFHHKRKVTAEDWDNVWWLARHANTRVTLKIQFRARLSPPKRGKLLADPDNAQKSTGEKSESPSADASKKGEDQTRSSGPSKGTPPHVAQSTVKAQPGAFSIFSCLNGVSKSDTECVDRELINDHLEEVDDWLRHMTSFGDVKAYKNCGRTSRSSIRHFLEEKGRELENSDPESREAKAEQRRFEEKIDIFNAADSIFQFFLPGDFEGRTVGKYWGAIESLIVEKPEEPHPRRPVAMFRQQLRAMSLSLASLNELLSHARNVDRVRITVPDEITEAWVHLILGLVNSERGEHAERLLDDASRLTLVCPIFEVMAAPAAQLWLGLFKSYSWPDSKL